MARLLKYAAVKAAASFARRYGVGMVVGVAVCSTLTRTVKRVPIVGPVVGATLSPLIGPVGSFVAGATLGCLATWGYNRGDIMAAKKKLFGG